MRMMWLYIVRSPIPRALRAVMCSSRSARQILRMNLPGKPAPKSCSMFTAASMVFALRKHRTSFRYEMMASSTVIPVSLAADSIIPAGSRGTISTGCGISATFLDRPTLSDTLEVKRGAVASSKCYIRAAPYSLPDAHSRTRKANVIDSLRMMLRSTIQQGIGRTKSLVPVPHRIKKKKFAIFATNSDVQPNSMCFHDFPLGLVPRSIR
jgi:hypothetical protein